jgi:hypothetical protein
MSLQSLRGLNTWHNLMLAHLAAATYMPPLWQEVRASSILHSFVRIAVCAPNLCRHADPDMKSYCVTAMLRYTSKLALVRAVRKPIGARCDVSSLCAHALN